MTVPHLLVFGPGYSASRLMRRVEARGWDVTSVRRLGGDASLAIDDVAGVAAAIRSATHILSSVPPDEAGDDPVLKHWAEALALAPARWVGYLSSTGVYGDTAGAWVDESAPIAGRRAGRNAADQGWAMLRADARVFRLPGIYGPGRSALERVRDGRAHQVDQLGQVFSRIHVDDLVSALIASMDSDATGIFNIADDLPDGQNQVMRGAAELLRLPPPPFVTLESLTPAARAFYAENRRVANGRAKRDLNWRLTYPTWREGLRACLDQM